MMFFPVPQETFDFSDFVGPFAEVEAVAEWTMPRTFAKVDEVAATSGDVAPSHPNQFEQLRDHVPHDICNQMAYDQDYGFYYVDRRAVRKYRYKMWRNPEHPSMWHLVKVPCTRDHRKKWVLCWDPKLATCASESEQVMMRKCPRMGSDLHKWIQMRQHNKATRWMYAYANGEVYYPGVPFMTKHMGYAQSGDAGSKELARQKYLRKRVSKRVSDEEEAFHDARSRLTRCQRRQKAKQNKRVVVEEEECFEDARTGFEGMTRHQKRVQYQTERLMHSGEAQIFNLPQNINVEHIFKIPLVEDFIAKIQEERPGVNWADIFAEVVFFFLHLRNGGFGVGNVTICTLHLLKNIRSEKLKAAIKMLLQKLRGLAQSIESILTVVSVCVTVVVSFVTAMVFSRLPSERSIDQFINRFSRVGHMIGSVEKISTYSEKFTEWTMGFARKAIFGYDAADFKPFALIDKFVEDVQKINTPDLELRMKDGSVTSARIKSLADRASHIQRILDAHRIPQFETRSFTSAALFVQKARDLFSVNGFGVLKPRIPPLVVHFTGPTGVGKTAMLDYLNCNILNERGCHDVSDLTNKVYYCYAQNAFFDGFQNGSEIVVFDDFGTVKDSISHPSPEPVIQIRGTNGGPWRPPMADLSGKATAVFEPSVVIWTSNRESYNWESITNPEAVHNRVHMRYLQEAHPNYRVVKNLNGTEVECLDVAKFSQDVKAGKVKRTDAWVFHRKSTEGSDPFAIISPPMTFEQVRDEVIAALKDKRSVGAEILEDRASYFSELVMQKTGKLPTNSQLPKVSLGDVHFSVKSETVTHQGPQQSENPFEDDDDIDEAVAEYRLKTKTEVEMLAEEKATTSQAVQNLTEEHWEKFVEYLAADRLVQMTQPTPIPWRQWFNRFLPWRAIGLPSHINVISSVLPMLEEFDKGVKDLKGWMDLRAQTCSPGWESKIVDFSVDATCLEVKPGFEDEALHGLREVFLGIIFQAAPPEFKLARMMKNGIVRVCCHRERERCRNSPTAIQQFKSVLQSVYYKAEKVLRYPLDPPNDLPSNRPLYNIFRKVLAFGTAFLLAGLMMKVFMWLLAPAFSALFWSPTPAKKKMKKGMVESADGTLVPVELEETATVMRAGDSENYQSGGAKASPSGRVEAYAGGEASAKPSGVCEGYSGGGAKAQPAGISEDAPEVIPVVDLSPKFQGPAQAWSDQNAGEIRTKVYRNLYCLFSGDDVNRQCKKGTVTFICGRIAMTNRHIAMNLGAHVTIIAPCGVSYKFETSDLNLYYVPDEHELYGQRDVALIEFPPTVHMHVNLVPYFVTKAEHKDLTWIEKMVMTNCGINPDHKNVFQHVYESRRVRAMNTQPFGLNYRDTTTVVRSFYLHDVETSPGDCGGLCIAFDKALPRKIFAIHMAGYNGDGYNGAAAAVNQELIDFMLKNMKLKHQHSKLSGKAFADSDIELVVDGHLVYEPEPIAPGFVPVGKVNNGVYSSGRSGIRESILMPTHGPSFRKPAYLRSFWKDEQFLEPMKIAMKKACAANLKTPSWALDEAANDVSQMICSSVLESDRRTLTFEEAIAGIEGDERYPPINRSTSCGYGWKHVPGKKGKTGYLGTDDYRFDHPVLLEKYETAMTKLRSGERLGHYWTDTLKDELRPIEKVDQGKTRLFSVGEMVMTILLRQYFDGFAAHMMRNHTELESCVGINPYSKDWDRLGRRLTSKGPHVIAGDFTNYDGSLPADVIWKVLDIVNDFYGEKDKEIRTLLWLEIVNSVHVNGNKVYMWTHGQPSGCPFTSLLNSVVHSIVVRVVFLLAAEKYSPHHCSLNVFNDYVVHNNYGDDDVTNVSASIIDWFNQLTMTEMYAIFGMVYTDELKSGKMVRAKTLPEIQFLKRKFVFDAMQCRYRAPLDIPTIRDMILWNKTKSAGDYELTALVLQDAIYELSQHPKPIFDEHFDYFDSARIQIYAHRPLRFLTYEGYQKLDYNRYVSAERPDQMLVIGASTHSPSESKQQILLSPSDLLHLGDAQAGEGEVFTSSDKCVPSSKSKLLIRRADQECLSESLVEESPLAMQQHNETDPLFKELTQAFLSLSQVYTDVMERRVGGWSPTDLMVSNTVRSVNRAVNSLITLRGAPGDYKAPVHKEHQAAMAMAYAEKIDELPPFLVEEQKKEEEREEDPAVTSLVEKMRRPMFLPLGHPDTKTPYFWMRLADRPTLDSSSDEEEAVGVSKVPKSPSSDGHDTVDECHEGEAEEYRDDDWFFSSDDEDEPRVVVTRHAGVAQSGLDEPVDVAEFAGADGIQTTKLDVTKLIADGQVTEETRQISRDVPKTMQCGAETESAITLKGFLGRPFLFRTGTWGKGSGRGAPLASFELPAIWVRQPYIKEKLAGFRFLRCTFHIELQVNAQPFNAGGLLMNFHPLESQNTVKPSNDVHLAGKMGKPYVVYRCNQDTSCRLKVPFFPIISHYDLTYAYGNAGVVRIEVLSPLTGADDVDYAIWIWADDIDITLPTGAAQSGNASELFNVKDFMNASKQLRGVKQVGEAPGLDEFADTAVKVVGTAANLAASFGWSKPVNPDVTKNIQPAHVRFMGNSNGPSDARVLALDPKNSIKIPHEVFNTTDDEMSVAVIASKFSPLQWFKFAKGDAPGKVLMQIPVDPSYCQTVFSQAVQENPGRFRFETYLSYLTSCAAMWRGSLKYRIQFFKTPFHSGRLRVSYVPWGALDNAGTFDRTKVFNEVHDIRSIMDIDLEFPYMYNQPWKPTPFLGAKKGDMEKNYVGVSPMGWLVVEVVTALRAPSTAADSIEALVYVSGGEDFQLAMPYINPHVKTLPTGKAVPTQPAFTDRVYNGPAQSGDNFTGSCQPCDVSVNTLGVGEIFTGFRQLLKRYTHMDVQESERPFVLFSGKDEELKDSIARHSTPIFRAGMLYRFQSGSLRWLLEKPKTGDHFLLALSPAESELPVGDSELRYTGIPTSLIPTADLPTEIQIPFYQMWPAQLTQVGAPALSFVYNNSSQQGVQWKRMPQNNGVRVIDLTGPSPVGVNYMAIGEDFSFGFLIGPPVTFETAID